MGKGVCSGVAIGKLCFVKRDTQKIGRIHIDDSSAELKRVEEATKMAISQLADLYEKALVEVGEQGAVLFQIHQMMLEDADYGDSVKNIIEHQQVNAEYAVAVTSDNFSRMFSEMEDAYMKERAADVKDISNRLLACLAGETQEAIKSEEPVIVAADDLSPSETIQLDKSKILAFVTSGGSTNSHTSILARTMGIPAIVGASEICEDMDGLEAIVDGFTGDLFIEPDQETITKLTEKKEEHQRKKDLLLNYKGKPNKTIDGKEIMVYANIGNPSELGAVQQNDAGGIGLLRSEFLYLESEDYPTEEILFDVYKTVAQTMGGKRVIVRTLDIGADKQIGYFDLPKEENPALGMRGIRICLTRTELFKTQLRALYRASAYGKVAIMFPMIASVWEVKKIKEILEEVKQDLREEGVKFDENVEIGIMIETPAAAVISDQLAPELDFFSIGTNDLTQYTLAVDRQNLDIEQFCDTHHEAVLRLIEMTVQNGHKHNTWVGICGELGADTSLTERFLRMGVDELSVSPTAVLELRKVISEIDLSK